MSLCSLVMLLPRRIRGILLHLLRVLLRVLDLPLVRFHLSRVSVTTSHTAPSRENECQAYRALTLTRQLLLELPLAVLLRMLLLVSLCILGLLGALFGVFVLFPDQLDGSKSCFDPL